MNTAFDQSPRLQPGRALKSAREAMGLSQEEVSSRTRIPIASIRAIEEEDWLQLPAPVYVRGFLRLYANELALDADEIVGAWRAAVGDAGGRPRSTSARRPSHHTERSVRWIGALAGLAAMAVVVGIVFALLTDDVAPTTGEDAGGGAPGQSVPVSSD